MANIKPYTDKIRGARYGREVRESIAAGIEAINDDVTDQATRAEAAADRAEAIAESIPADYTSLTAEVHANTQKNREQDGRISTNESDIAILRSAVDGNIITHESLTGEAYEVPLRSGTIGARVQSVGGKSYKSKNLADPTINISNSQGSCVSNEDGTVTMSATSPIVFVDYSVKTILKANTDYFISGCPAGGLSPGGYFLRIRNADTQAAIGSIDVGNGFLYRPAEDTSVSLAYYWNASSSSGAVTFKPMIEEGSQKTDFEPYFEGIRNTAVEGFTNRGKNLLNPTDFINDCYLDGNGNKITAISGARVYYIKCEKGITYSVSREGGDRCSVAESSSFPAVGATITNLTNFGDSSTSGTITTQGDGYLLFYANRYATSVPSEVQIEKGSSASTYKPYKEPEPRSLPSSVLSLPNYGHGLPNASNTLHFEERVYQNMKAVDLGDVIFTYQSTSGHERFRCANIPNIVSIDASVVLNGISNKYAIDTANATYSHTQDKIIGSNGGILWLYDSALGASDLDASGHITSLKGVLLHYEAAEGGEEYKAKVYEEKVNNKELGSMSWIYREDSSIFYSTDETLGERRTYAITSFCNKYTARQNVSSLANAAAMPDASVCLYATSTYHRTYIKDLSKTGSDLINGHAAWLEGVDLTYELAVPRIYDMTGVLADFSPLFNTEGGGSITFENEHQKPVPYNLYNTIKNSEAIS